MLHVLLLFFKITEVCAVFHTDLVLVFFKNIFASSKEKGNTPNRRKTYDGVNDSAYKIGLSAEEPAYNIKFK